MFVNYAIHPNSIEPIRNSIRLLVTTLVIVLFGQYIVRLKALFLVFAVLNSCLIVLQAMNYYSPILPDFLRAENLVHFKDYRQSFRNPGVLFGFQIASFVTVYALEIIITLKFRTRLLVICIMILSLSFGSRIVLISYGVYNLVLRPRITLKISLLVSTLILIVISLIKLPDVFIDYFNLRFGFIPNLFDGSMTDYSARDTISFYDNIKNLSIAEFVIGNGYPQYSIKGGNDPLYLRYLFQTGVLSLIIIVFSIVYLILTSRFLLRFKLLFVLLFLFTSMKGELFTGLLSFELFVILFLYGKRHSVYYS